MEFGIMMEQYFFIHEEKTTMNELVQHLLNRARLISSISCKAAKWKKSWVDRVDKKGESRVKKWELIPVDSVCSIYFENWNLNLTRNFRVELVVHVAKIIKIEKKVVKTITQEKASITSQSITTGHDYALRKI